MSSVPGDLDFNVAFISGQGCFEAGLLPVGEVLGAGAQDVTDPVERVGLTASVAVDFLLDSAADLVDGSGAEFHNMERVEYRDGVFQLVIDGVLVAVERVQRRDLDPLTERLAAVTKPGRIHLTGASRDQIEEPSPDTSILVAGEIDHAGELFRAAAALVDRFGRHVMPDVFINTKGRGSSSSAAASRTGVTARHNVFHVQPSCRATPCTEAFSHRICLTAQIVARRVNNARG